MDKGAITIQGVLEKVMKTLSLKSTKPSSSTYCHLKIGHSTSKQMVDTKNKSDIPTITTILNGDTVEFMHFEPMQHRKTPPNEGIQLTTKTKLMN